MPAANPFPARASRDGLQALSGTCSERDMVRLITGNHMRSVNPGQRADHRLSAELQPDL